MPYAIFYAVIIDASFARLRLMHGLPDAFALRAFYAAYRHTDMLPRCPHAATRLCRLLLTLRAARRERAARSAL